MFLTVELGIALCLFLSAEGSTLAQQEEYASLRKISVVLCWAGFIFHCFWLYLIYMEETLL